MGFTFNQHWPFPLIAVNDQIIIIAKLIKSVITSAAEVEVAAFYMNTKELVSLQITCEELGHKETATPMRTDNNTACGILTGMF